IFENTSVLRKFNEYLHKNNILLVIKRHPFDKTHFQSLSNIKDYSDNIVDVQELLVCTDILITDYSSVFFDFSLTNRPIIFYAYDYNEYLENCRGMYFDYYKEMLGPFARNESELLHLI